MRILYLCGQPDLPEAHLIRGIAEQGNHGVVALDPAARHRVLLEGRSDLSLVPLVFGSRVDLAAVRTIRRLLRSERFDLVHAFTGRAISAAVLATLGRPLPIVAYRGTMGNVSRLDPAAWLSFLNPKVRRLVCVSNAVRNDLLGLRRPESLVTIYKGHDLAWYDAVQPVSRSEFGIPPSAFTIVCTANMRPLKGVDILIRAFHALPASAGAHLLLVGDVRDETLPRLASEGRNADRIHFTGFRPDAAAVTAGADLMVMPTLRREGLPKAVIEAMARGIPAVVSNVGGMPELVADGECGLVVPPGNPAALASALESLIADRPKLERFGAAARERIRERFSLQESISKTLALYRNLVA